MNMIRLAVGLAIFSFAPVVAFAMGGGEAQSSAALVNNMLQQAEPAADFTLIDQNGQSFHMADQKGKVVLLSFIYTHCTDICPYVAAKVKEVYQQLGTDAKNVSLVAVTTDPKRDVPSVTLPYSKALGMADAWHFVGGDAKAVQAVWSSYGIGVTVNPDTDAVAAPKEENSGGQMAMDQVPTQGLSQADITLAAQIADQFGGGYDVGHSAPFWIVDKKGTVRVLMDADATPADIATNIRALLKLK